MEDVANQMQIPSEKLEKIRQVPRCIASLDESIGPDRTCSLVNLIEDENITSSDDAVAQSHLLEAIGEALNTLPDREHQVIRLRFGIDDGDPHTLARIGHKLGISRERVRQIERRALLKLRHPARICLLGDFA
jgi:RNA polymerase primary sigma factor